MNSIKIYLLSIIFLTFFSNQLFSQNDFYNDKKADEKIEQIVSNTNIDSVDYYTTEKDFIEGNNGEVVQYEDDSEFYEDEVYSDERDRKRKKNTVAGEIAAEVILEVFFNAVLIIATCWH